MEIQKQNNTMQSSSYKNLKYGLFMISIYVFSITTFIQTLKFFTS